jgi:hypothetical protein
MPQQIISREMRATRRPFKTAIHAGSSGVQLDRGRLANPNHRTETSGRRPFSSRLYMSEERTSDFITTRCYSPTGQQIWDGDHGNTVYALAVTSNGTVYQSGAGHGTASIIGPSLFHRGAEDDAPLVTAMRPGGQPLWSIKQSSPSVYSYGIAAGTDGYLYYSKTNEQSAPFTGYVAKLRGTTGEDILHLPIAGFTNVPSTGQMGRVRCDAAGNPYAIHRTGFAILKWVNDVEFWVAGTNLYTGLRPTGLAVSDNGHVFLPQLLSLIGGGGNTETIDALYILDSQLSNLPGLGMPTVLASFQESTNSSNTLGYKQAGCSPNGNQWVSHNPITGYVTGTKSAVVIELGGSVFVPYAALAINDSGVYCHSVPRLAGIDVHSHVIRAADNSIITTMDHGGEIFDAVVLPDGRFIVAGARVSRRDFP